MIYPKPLFRFGRRGDSGPLSPGQIPTPVFWLIGSAGTFQDSGFTTPAVVDLDPLGGWQDQSGNANHFTQPAGANRGVFRTAALNGLPGCRAAAANQFLFAPSIPALAQRETSHFAVVAATAIGGTSRMAVFQEYNPNPGARLYHSSSGPGFAEMGQSSAAGVGVIATTVIYSTPFGSVGRSTAGGEIDITDHQGNVGSNTGADFNPATKLLTYVLNDNIPARPATDPVVEIACWARRLTDDEVTRLLAYAVLTYALT